MELLVGPLTDIRPFKLILPEIKKFKSPLAEKLFLKLNQFIDGKHIGIFVSGGIDSAILYFLLLEENLRTGNKFNIVPYTIRRMGAEQSARNVIRWIHDFYNIPDIDLNIVGDPSLPEIQQVESGVNDVLGVRADYVYLGIIYDRPEHSLNWDRFKFVETFKNRYPFLHLEKTHILDLYIKKNVLELLKLTHSCNTNIDTDCMICNGCQAKIWAFNKMGLRTE